MTEKMVPEGGAKVFASGSSDSGDFRSGEDKTPEVTIRTAQDQTGGMNTKGKKEPQPNALKDLPAGGDTFTT